MENNPPYILRKSKHKVKRDNFDFAIVHSFLMFALGQKPNTNSNKKAIFYILKFPISANFYAGLVRLKNGIKWLIVKSLQLNSYYFNMIYDRKIAVDIIGDNFTKYVNTQNM